MTMKICSNYTQSTEQSHLLPSKLNIKLKTHSLTSLNVPLETFVGFNKSSSSFDHDYRKAMAGSVDHISEIRQQSNEEIRSDLSSTKPLINMVSSHEQPSTIQSEWRQILNHRFRMSTSSISPSSLNDSIARLRLKNRFSNHHHQSSSTQRTKSRVSLLRHSSIPKFTLRDLPSDNRSTKSPKKQYEQSCQTSVSMFTSLPEICSFVEQNCIDHLTTINDKSQSTMLSTPYWEKSGSWSWKSNDVNRFNQIKNEQRQYFDDHLRSNLPVIIESPLRQRSSLQTLNQNHHEIRRSNLSFQLYQKKPSVSRSFSNYAVSSKLTNRSPSTPLLAYSRDRHISKFPSHSTQFYFSPLATFDDDDDDNNNDTDSITSDSTFRSCFDSINECTQVHSDELSSLSDSDYSEIFFNLDSTIQNNSQRFKHSHSPVRHLCTVQ